MPPLPAAALTSLTYLQCHFWGGSINELAAFTQLRHLAVVGHSDSTGSLRLVFQQALPQLQALTHLSVSDDLTRDAVLQGLAELPCLQDLRITSNTCTAALFEVLQASLTRLEIERKYTWDSKLELPLSSTTHLQRLTALQHFALSEAREVHPSVLTVLTALTQLDVTCCSLRAGPQEAGWHVLSLLANLQHLNLQDTFTGRAIGQVPQLTAADIAALTAPRQLSYLHISTDVAQQEDLKHLLPADRQLHSLKELHASMDLAADLQVMVQLPHRCPNLQVLDLSMPAEGPGVDVFENHEFAALCDALGGLPELRTLQLNSYSIKTIEPATWEALGSLEQLHSLSIFCVEWEALHHVLELTTCWQLTRLMVHTYDAAEYEVINEAPAGCPSDVWDRMPQVLLDAVQWHLENIGEKDPHALACMAHTAAGIAAYAVDVMNEQQEEVQELQQQLAESQEQVFALQQQLQAMQMQLQLQEQQQQLEQQQ